MPPPHSAGHSAGALVHSYNGNAARTAGSSGNGNGESGAGTGGGGEDTASGQFKGFKHRKSRWNRKPDDMLGDQQNNKLIASTLSLFKDPSIEGVERKIKEIENLEKMERESKLSKSRTTSDDESRAHSKKLHKRRSASSRKGKRTSSRSHSRNTSASRSRSRSRKRREKKDKSDSDAVDMSISDRDSDSTTSSPDRSTPSKSRSKSPSKSVSKSPSKSALKAKSVDAVKGSKSMSASSSAVVADGVNSKYVVSKDINLITNHYRNHGKRNYAKLELERTTKITSELQKYMKRTAKRKRSGSNFKASKLRHPVMQTALSTISATEQSMADNEMSSALDDGHPINGTNGGPASSAVGPYDHDLNNSDSAIYEPPFKKPRFMPKMKEFVSRQMIHPEVVRKAVDLNESVMSYRLKHREERLRYIKIERAQSEHWNRSPKKCWFYRCVHMLEGHVENMCLSPDMAPGVMAPTGPLNEIETRLSRIHPLPPLLYKRLFKTLRNLANLIRTYPDAVVWDKGKLTSIFEKAIRKQAQMETIYDFDRSDFEHYDFAPFTLPQHEVDRISFYREGHDDDDEHRDLNGRNAGECGPDGGGDKDRSVEALGPMQRINRRCSTMSGVVEDDMDEEEDDDDDEAGFGMLKSRSITPSDGTPALSLRSVTPMDMDSDSVVTANTNDRRKMNLSINTQMGSRYRSQSRSLTPITPKAPVLISSSTASSRRKVDVLPMDTPLNMDLVRKTSVRLNAEAAMEEEHDENEIVISEGIQQMVMANCLRLERLLDGKKASGATTPGFANGDGNGNGNGDGDTMKSRSTTGNGQSNDCDGKQEAKREGAIGMKLECKASNTATTSMGATSKTTSVSPKASKRRVTWYVDGLDSDDETVPTHLRAQKEKLQDIFRQNGVYGPIRAIGLEPTKQSDIPTLYELPPKYRNLYDNRTPSISYLISNFVDTTNPWYIRLLLKFFTVQLAECSNRFEQCPTARITVDLIRKQLTKRPQSMRRCFIGDTKEEEVYFWYNINDGGGGGDAVKSGDTASSGETTKEVVWSPFVRSTLSMELYLDLDLHQNLKNSTTLKTPKEFKQNAKALTPGEGGGGGDWAEGNVHHIRLRLKENKRHKLLCSLLRIKHHRKKGGHGGVALRIPPPPPPAEDKKVSERILRMNSICVDYNWNGHCETAYCGKKHVCSSCQGKHPARICKKQCVHFNWAKCQKYCPRNKQHSCSQCGHRAHPAWKCQYLHKSVVDRYYAIYKTKKMKKGHLKERETKKRNKQYEEMAKIIKKNGYSIKDGQANKLQAQIANLNQNLSTLQSQNMAPRRHPQHLSHHHTMAATMRRSKRAVIY